MEVVLSDYGKKNSYESFLLRGNPYFADQLKNSNFKLLNIANNHIQQHGNFPFYNTIDILKQNKIKIIGVEIIYNHKLSSLKALNRDFLVTL